MHQRPTSPYRSPDARPRLSCTTSRAGTRPRNRATQDDDVRGSLPLDVADHDSPSALDIALALPGEWGRDTAAGARDSRTAARRDPGGGSSTSLPGTATDSAYGTLDELDTAHDEEGDEEDDARECRMDPVSWATERGPAWRDQVEASLIERSRRRVQSAVAADGWQLRDRGRREAGDGLYWRRTLGARRQGDSAESSPEVVHEPVFTFDLAYDADSSFDSLRSLCPPFAAHPSGPTSLCSSRSSPEPSECGESDSAATRLTMARKRRTPLTHGCETAEELAASFLARRHTLPRRHKVRGPGRKASSSSLRKSSCSSLRISEPDTASPLSLPSAPTPSPPLPVVSQAVIVATCVVSLASFLSPTPLVMPVSPVHLRHAMTPLRLAGEVANAAFAPFLVQPSFPSLVLSAINLYLVRYLYLEFSTSETTSRAKGALATALWAAIVGLRVLASWVFGRVLGWAHPQYLSTRAIHEVGAGLGPLLLALYLVHLVTARRDDALPALVPALLGASFLVPVDQGGAGLWLGACAAVVGVVVSFAIVFWSSLPAATRTRPPQPLQYTAPVPRAACSWTSPFLALALLPSLALYPSTSRSSPQQTDLAFSQLHPLDPTLLTVLLMTAPRPRNPDFLLRTIESWLGAFPDPDPLSTAFATNGSSSAFDAASTVPSTSSRLRLVVYTHFATHPTFDHARAHFVSSAKAAHYVSWQRDPRALGPGAQDRLDQRLHVARGLEHAAGLGGAYVLLTEDDFPLCEDAERADELEGQRTWAGTWKQLQAALVATNERMPDAPSLLGDRGEASMGHCGLFLATGGSGLAIRTPLAARLPALLLGPDDPHGYAREAAAARGEIELRREGEGADTPDLVIQDCLRGRLPECAVCAPGAAVAAPVGSARHPSRRAGERWGKSGLAGTERLLQRHLGYNASTLPGRQYGREEWACGWRQPFNGEPDVLTV